MKKFIIAFALSLAAVCLSAQDLSVLSKAAKFAYDQLAESGYRPSLDEDTDVAFKAEGYSFYVDNDRNDETYLRVVLPAVYEVDVDDFDQLFAALAAANEFSRTKKLVRAGVDGSGTVSFVADSYVGDISDIEEFLETAIDFMVRAISSWKENFDYFMED